MTLDSIFKIIINAIGVVICCLVVAKIMDGCLPHWLKVTLQGFLAWMSVRFLFWILVIIFKKNWS